MDLPIAETSARCYHQATRIEYVSQADARIDLVYCVSRAIS